MPPISIMSISDMFYDLVFMIDCPVEPPQPEPVRSALRTPMLRSESLPTGGQACRRVRSQPERHRDGGWLLGQLVDNG